jgi:hypothetical protein
MNGENSVNRDALLETFAAELTLAAYRVALQSRTQGITLGQPSCNRFLSKGQLSKKLATTGRLEAVSPCSILSNACQPPAAYSEPARIVAAARPISW